MKEKRDVYVPVIIALLSRVVILLAGTVWNLTHDTSQSLFELLYKLDAGWYKSIIEEGYMKTPLESGQPGAANWAFFPLYPLITGVISDVTGIASTVVGPLVSTVLFIAAVMVIFRYATLTRNRDNAILAVTIFSFGPYSFYFSCFYTEALFLLLVACSFYYLEKKEWLAAGLCGALLSATRPTGVLIFFPLLVKMITSYDADKKSLPSLARHIFSDEKKILALSVVPLGLFSYATYLYFLVGDPFAFKNVEIAWDRDFSNPLIVLYKGLTGSMAHKYLAFWGILGMACSAYLYHNKKYSEAIFGFVLITISASTAVFSLQRYFIGSFVLVLALSDIIGKSNSIKWPGTCFMCSMNVLLLFLWFLGKHSVMQ